MELVCVPPVAPSCPPGPLAGTSEPRLGVMRASFPPDLADNGAGLTQGIIGLCTKASHAVDDWGNCARGPGVKLAPEYFETDKSVDATKVGLEGHSRYGKAALVAMAYDSFAVVFVSSSGEGGKTSSSHWGELRRTSRAQVSITGWRAIFEVRGSAALERSAGRLRTLDRSAPRPVLASSGATGDGC